MRSTVLAACVSLVAVPALAQTSGRTRTNPPGAAPRTITVSGCVSGGDSASKPFILDNPVVVPAAQTPPGSVGAPGTAATGGTVEPSAAAVGGASGTSGSTPTVGSVAANPAAPASGSAVPPAVASGGSNPSIAGYRLTGSDFKPWSGQHVEVTGTLIRANPGVASGAGAATAMPEFRVQSVRPLAGSCTPR